MRKVLMAAALLCALHGRVHAEETAENKSLDQARPAAAAEVRDDAPTALKELIEQAEFSSKPPVESAANSNDEHRKVCETVCWVRAADGSCSCWRIVCR
ncbi:MAG: hypothetical protein ACHQ49_06880 [Elusimicrobiota bacterium]